MKSQLEAKIPFDCDPKKLPHLHNLAVLKRIRELDLQVAFLKDDIESARSLVSDCRFQIPELDTNTIQKALVETKPVLVRLSQLDEVDLLSSDQMASQKNLMVQA